MFFYKLITDPVWENFMNDPERYAQIANVLWWFGPMSWCAVRGVQPTLPVVFALTTVSLMDPASFVEVPGMTHPLMVTPCLPDTLIEGVDYDSNMNTEPYVDISPWWLITGAFVTGVCIMGLEVLVS